MDYILNMVKDLFSSFIYDDGVILCPESCDVQWIVGWLCFIITTLVVVKKLLPLVAPIQEYIKVRKQVSAEHAAKETTNHDVEKIEKLKTDLKSARAEVDEWREKYANTVAAAKQLKRNAQAKIAELQENQITVVG